MQMVVVVAAMIDLNAFVYLINRKLGYLTLVVGKLFNEIALYTV